MIVLLTSIIFICCLLHIATCGTLSASQQDEQKLITILLDQYNKNIRPDDQISIDITAKLNQILSIDEKQQIMTSSLFISQTWFDDRLSWLPNTTNTSIEVVMLPVKSLWIPDTMIINSADPSGYLTVTDYSLASVYYTGQVYLILPALTIKTKCNLLVQKFPFDKQICNINLTSWSQGYNRIAYTENSSSLVDLHDYTEHPLWLLYGTDVVVIRAGDRVPFEDTFNAIISIQLYLKRKPLFFILNGIFACLILNCVTLLSFTVPFIVQINLCMTCFLTYSVYSLNFSSLFPQQSEYLMFITLFFLISIWCTFLSMVWFILQNDFISKGDMPKLLYIFCGQLQRLLPYCFPTNAQHGKTITKNTIDISINNGNKSQILLDAESVTVTNMQQFRVDNASQKQNTKTEHEKPAIMNPTNIELSKTTTTADSVETKQMIETTDLKCNFCNRCNSCQTNVDNENIKMRKKKDIDNRCKALNYFVFLCVLSIMFISNVALWLWMSL